MNYYQAGKENTHTRKGLNDVGKGQAGLMNVARDVCWINTEVSLGPAEYLIINEHIRRIPWNVLQRS